MKKVGIITYFATNYGAFLQSYALQQYLKKRGYSPELINYDYYHDRTIIGLSYENIDNPVKFCASVLKRLLKLKKYHEKEKVFAESIEKKLSISDTKYKSYTELKTNPPIYDIYITGSDQVFNPNINPQAFDSRLLSFVSKEAIKISYAASLGIPEYSKEIKSKVKKELSSFFKISLREESSLKTISELTDKDVVRNCDPTFLLCEKEWKEFGEEFQVNEKYIFVYMLENQPELVSYVNKLSDKTNLKVLNLGNGHFKNEIGHKTLNPMQFIYAIASAEYVVANSFHALVFSIHFKKRARMFYPAHVSQRLRETVIRYNIEILTENYDICNAKVENIYSSCESIIHNEISETDKFFSEIEASNASK